MPKITTYEQVQIPQIAFHPARAEPLPPADDAAFFSVSEQKPFHWSRPKSTWKNDQRGLSCAKDRLRRAQRTWSSPLSRRRQAPASSNDAQNRWVLVSLS